MIQRLYYCLNYPACKSHPIFTMSCCIFHGLSSSAIFSLTTLQMAQFSEKYVLYVMCFLTFSMTFFQNILHSTNNSGGCYRKRPYVFL